MYSHSLSLFLWKTTIFPQQYEVSTHCSGNFFLRVSGGADFSAGSGQPRNAQNALLGMHCVLVTFPRFIRNTTAQKVSAISTA